MRVVSVITRLNIGGASPPVISLAAGLKARGHQSLLVIGTPQPAEGSLEGEARRAGVDLVQIAELCRNPHPAKDPVALFKLVRLFRRFRPDIVATHMSKAGALGRIAARFAGVPVAVHTYHGKGFHVFEQHWKERVAFKLEQVLASLSSGSIVVSRRQLEEFLSIGVAPADRLEVIRYGLDLDPFLCLNGVEGKLADDLGLPSGAVIVGVVARLVTIKGQHMFLQAARLVIDRGVDAHFVLAGDGEQRAELEALARDLHLEQRVHFLGWRRDIPALLAGLQIVVLPTIMDFEGTPLAVIEALAAARAVIATNVGGVAEVVRDGETGSLVSPRDPAALADAIAALIQNTALARRMGANGRELVRHLYRRDRMIDETEAYFLRLAAERCPEETPSLTSCK